MLGLCPRSLQLQGSVFQRHCTPATLQPAPAIRPAPFAAVCECTVQLSPNLSPYHVKCHMLQQGMAVQPGTLAGCMPATWLLCQQLVYE
jgi:hypothetical protein